MWSLLFTHFQISWPLSYLRSKIYCSEANPLPQGPEEEKGNPNETLTNVPLSESRRRLQLMQNCGVLPNSECKYYLNSRGCESTPYIARRRNISWGYCSLYWQQNKYTEGSESIFILGLTHQSTQDKWLMKSKEQDRQLSWQAIMTGETPREMRGQTLTTTS